VLYWLRREKGEPFRLSLFPGLLAAILADILICYSFAGGAALFLVGHVLLIVAFQHRNRMTKGRWVQWAILSAAVIALIGFVFVPMKGLYAWIAAVYAPVILLMRCCGGRQTVRIRFASLLFLVSDVLLAVYFAMLSEPMVHILYMLLFYLALLNMATGSAVEKKEPDAAPSAEEALPETETAPAGTPFQAKPEKRRKKRKDRKVPKTHKKKRAETPEPAE
jgi:uncharacterized membrane protein YhhN